MASNECAAADHAETRVSEWSADTQAESAPVITTAGPHENRPVEFIISFNWVLLGKGLDYFYQVLYEYDQNYEIRYDVSIQGFRVKCFSRDEVKIVVMVKEILADIVQSETKTGFGSSTTIISLEQWRKIKHDKMEPVVVTDRYLFPRDVASCSHRCAWNIPENALDRGITTILMLPDIVRARLQELTGATILMSTNRRTIYIGASKDEVLHKVKQKLDTLAKFLELKPQDMAEVVNISLYNEGDRSVAGEYRYMADGNEKLLRSYILDRCDWLPGRYYTRVFKKGVIVLPNPQNQLQGRINTISDSILPIAEGRNLGERFAAFKPENWTYPAKEKTSHPTAADRPGIESAGSQDILRPRIENWVSGLPIPQGSSRNSSSWANVSVGSSQVSMRNDLSRGAFSLEHQPTHQAQEAHVSPHDQFSRGSSNDRSEINKKNHMISQRKQQHRPTGSSTPTTAPSTEGTVAANDDLASVTKMETANELNEARPGDLMPDQALQKTAVHRKDQERIPDPFEHLWKAHAPVRTKPAPRSRKESDYTFDQSSALEKDIHPKLSQSQETDTRSFHVTMNQKAGSRAKHNQIFPEFDLGMMPSINKSLMRLLAPLRLWPGMVELKIEIGRLCFTNVKKSHVQEPRVNDSEKHYKLGHIREHLSKRHTHHDKILFTRILTSFGADANHIAHMRDSCGDPMWLRPTNGRSSTYEFTCRSRTMEGPEFQFIIEIDTRTFSSKVRAFKPDKSCFPIHCIKRVWDFQLVLAVSHHLDDMCRRFTDDLVRSLQVRPTNDQIPELKVSYDRSYDIDILVVRIRNTACCTSEVGVANKYSTQAGPGKDTQRLHISEVWEMDRTSHVHNEQYTQLSFTHFKNQDQHPGVPLMWYEVSLTSDIFSTAFRQNIDLEIGDEASWSPEELLGSGAIEKLALKAATMVKGMDGVGFWNDNRQHEQLHTVMPTGRPSTEKFW